MSASTTGRVRRGDRVAAVAPLAVAALTSLALAVLSLRRFARYEPASWDNAIFEQALRSYAERGWPLVEIKGPGYNLLGDHFHPLLAALAPVYALVPSAQTLLVAQVVLIGVGVAVVGRLAARELGPWPGVAVALAMGVSFGVQSAAVADFHEVALGVPLLALAGAAYVRRDWRAVALWSLPLLLVKEDLGLTVAVIGAVVWLGGARRVGTALAAVGVLGWLLVVTVLLPALNTSGGYDYTGNLGGERGLLATLLTDVDVKLGTVALTLGVTAFVACRSPWVLLVLPTFAWRFVGDVEFYWGTQWHYSLLLMPVVFVAMVDALVRLRGRGGTAWRVARWAPAVAVVVALVRLPASPLGDLADPATYGTPARAHAAQAAVDLVPSGASVVADIGTLTHLVTDHEAYWIGTVAADARPDYVVLDTAGGFGSPGDAAAWASETFGVPYDLVHLDAGFQVAQRRR
jgi:uncharacterized membrane protein